MTYRTEFTTAEMRRFPVPLQHVIVQAFTLGWVGKITGAGGAQLLPPKGVEAHRIYVPQTCKDPENVAKSLLVKVLRSAPEPDEDGEIVRDSAFGPIALTPTFTQFTPVLPEPEADVPSKEQAPVAKPADALDSRSSTDRREGSSPSGGTDIIDVLRAHGTGDQVLTVSPWLARKHVTQEGAQKYASEAVNERRWVSGRVDYVCSWAGCGWSAEKPHSVRNHYRKHKTPVSTERPTLLVDPEDVTPIYKGAVTRLANEITAAMATLREEFPDPRVFESPEDLARLLAERIFEARRRRGEPLLHDAHPDTPVTPEQMLDRIRAILMGQEIENQRALLTRIDSLSAEVVSLAAAKQAAEERAQRLADTLDAFASLANEARREVVSRGQERSDAEPGHGAGVG